MKKIKHGKTIITDTSNPDVLSDGRVTLTIQRELLQRELLYERFPPRWGSNIKAVKRIKNKEKKK